MQPLSQPLFPHIPKQQNATAHGHRGKKKKSVRFPIYIFVPPSSFFFLSCLLPAHLTIPYVICNGISSYAISPQMELGKRNFRNFRYLHIFPMCKETIMLQFQLENLNSVFT